ncbi:MAG: DUF2191 domain-containing protein [Alphaproteobacteria bacterium]|nr:DUF2191 domain-containing protein [Alphaproteobacteria bacterium]
MRTTVRLPENLLRRAKRKAAAEGRTLTALIAEGLTIVLGEARESTGQKRVQLPVSAATGGTLPGVDLDDSAALEDIMERE